MNSPFNEAKYRALLEGLEVSVIHLSESFENKDFRIDSDFFTKAPTVHAKHTYVPIGSILKAAQYGISIEMNQEQRGYPIYRMNEIHNMLCDFEVDKHADIALGEFQKFKLNDRDVLFNRTNSYEWVGRTGIYRKTKTLDFTFASYLVRFIPDENKVLPEYLTAFLNSKVGVWDIKRRARHSINQTNVNPEEVKAIMIPLLSIEFQYKIKKLFDIGCEKLLLSQNSYSQAEALLLETLGLSDFDFDAGEGVNSNVKMCSASFLASGRLDAEYYQRKYEVLVERIKSNKSGYKRLGELVSIVKSVETGSDAYSDVEGIPYLRVSNMTKMGLIQPDIRISPDYYLKNREILDKLRLKKNTILLSKDGTICMAYKVPKDLEMISSGALLHLKIKDEAIMLPDYLTLLLNLPIAQKQAERDAGGSIIIHWRVSEIEQLLVPLLDLTMQQRLSESINNSFHLKSEAETLLHVAKQAVETAIEQGEAAGMALLGAHQHNGTTV